MWNTNDCISFLLLESKYGTQLDGYDRDKSAYFLNEFIKHNRDCLEFMNKSQELLLRSALLCEEEKDFEGLRKCKESFDKRLEEMIQLSKALEIAVTPKPNGNETNESNEIKK